MLKELKILNKADRKVVMDAIPLITILIAGADGAIDKKETDWATRMTEIRSYDANSILLPYYKEIGETFSERLDELIAELPKDVDERQEIIAERLAKINKIFPQIDSLYAKYLYDSLLSFSKHVANASGGFLGFFSISNKEHNWVNLPMIEEPVV